MKKKNYMVNLFAVMLVVVLALALKGCGGGGTSSVLAPVDNNAAASTVTYEDALPADLTAKDAADITAFDTSAPTTFYDGTTISTSGATTQAITACNNCHATTQYTTFLQTPHYNNSVTCESCHGVSSQHTPGAGDKNKIIAGWQAMSASTCANCHSAYFDEWEKAGHSVSKDASHGSSSCTPCHTGEGFIEFVAWSKANDNDDILYFLDQSGAKTVTGAETEGNGAHNVNCAACHDPHETSNASQLRVDKLKLCIMCHNGRKKLPGDSHAPHRDLQGRVLNGQGLVNTSGKLLWDRNGYLCSNNEETTAAACGTSSTYETIITDITPVMGAATTCVDCHMYSNATAGYKGHTFKPNSEKCKSCHTGMNTVAAISSIQSNFEAIYNPVKARLDAATAAYDTDASGEVTNADTGPTAAQLKAYYQARWNMEYIEFDGSKGVHNFDMAERAIEYTDAILKTIGY